MKIAADDCPGVAATLLAELRSSPFRSPKMWRHAVVVNTPERHAVMHRAAFAESLRADGLHDAAREVTARYVGPGEVLTYTVVDNEHAAGVVFMVVQLRPRGH